MLDFKTIYDKHWGALVYYGYKLTGNEEHAKDMAQDAFIRVSQILINFPTEAPVRDYLWRAIKTRSINYRKKTNCQEKYLDDNSNIVDLIEIETDLVEMVYRHMQAMPTQRKKIFKMLFFDGLKLPEIAQLLHISINTVKSQRAKALIQLRKEFT